MYGALILWLKIFRGKSIKYVRPFKAIRENAKQKFFFFVDFLGIYRGRLNFVSVQPCTASVPEKHDVSRDS